jgi:flagellar biosynthesis protein FliR
MIRFLLRFLGLWILAAAFIFLVYDGAGWVANGVLNSVEVQDLWSNIHQSSLQALEPTVTTVLKQPVWLVFGIIGAILILLGRKKKPLIGYVRD